MGLCNQLHDKTPTRHFLVDLERYHNKFTLLPREKERMDFAEVDANFISSVWEGTGTPA